MKVRNYAAVCLVCSHCGNIEKIRLNLFDFSGNDEKLIRCPKCNHIICKINTDMQKKYRLEVSCAECGGRHKFKIPVSEFWQTKEKFFCCSLTDKTAFAVGSDNSIENIIHSKCDGEDIRDTESGSMYDAENIYSMISKDNSAFINSEEFFNCLEHFRILSEENAVTCDCRGNAIQLQIEEDGFRIICQRCGRELFLDFSSREKIDKIMMLNEIRLH